MPARVDGGGGEEGSLRGRRLKGKGKGVLGKGILGARETRGWSRALIPFPFPFERLSRRLGRGREKRRREGAKDFPPPRSSSYAGYRLVYFGT